MAANASMGMNGKGLRLENARVVDPSGEGSVSGPCAIVIEGDTISAVTEAGQGALGEMPTIDLAGHYVMPGLCDMHTHLSYTECLSDQAVQDELFLYLAHGVTTIRNMSGSAWYIVTRDRIRRGELLGPRLFTTGPILETIQTHDAIKPPSIKLLATADEARAEVFAEKSAGYDFIKVYNQTSRDVFHAIMDAAGELDISVIGHVSIDAGLEDVLARRQASIEHLRGIDLELSSNPRDPAMTVRLGGWRTASGARISQLAAQSAAAGAWHVPTLLSYQMLDESDAIQAMAGSYPFLPEHIHRALSNYYLKDIFPPAVQAAIREGIPNMLAFVKAFQEAGGRLLAGTDAGAPGVGMAAEIANFQAAGLTVAQALQTATTNPDEWFASYLPASQRAGAIAAGCRADLVMLAGNPLEDLATLRRPAGVVAAGVYLSRAAIDDRLADIRSRNPALATLAVQH